MPGRLAALAGAFWRRSFARRVTVVNAMVLMQVAWTFVIFGTEGALYHLVPAAFGLVACNAILALAWWAWRRRQAA